MAVEFYRQPNGAKYFEFVVRTLLCNNNSNLVLTFAHSITDVIEFRKMLQFCASSSFVGHVSLTPADIKNRSNRNRLVILAEHEIYSAAHKLRTLRDLNVTKLQLAKIELNLRSYGKFHFHE